ncbi:MAG: hypothetical protein DRG78_18095, partial [Epsilonproteobacteria bacterium]
MMKNIVIFVSLLFILCANANSEEQPTNIIKQKQILTTTQLEYIKNKKQIKMCIDPSWMPYESFDKNGRYIGMSADLFKIFSKDIGIDIVPVKTKTWSESVSFAKMRKCDIYSLAMETKERKQYMKFTSPYLSIPLVVATKPNITFVDTIASLNGKKIGIVKDYAFNEILRKKYPNINIVDVNNINNGLQQVVDGKLFGFIGTISSVGYKFQTTFLGELKISGKFDEKWELGIGVRDDEPILFDILQNAVNNLTQEEKQKVLNKWLSIKLEKVTSYKYIKELFFVFVIFVLISLYWMRKISIVNKQIKNSLEDFEYIFNNTIETMGFFQQNLCVNLNQAGIKLFKFKDLEDAKGKTPLDFIAPDSVELVRSKIINGSTQPYEANAIKQDGVIFPVLIKGQYKEIGGIQTRITSLIDLSDLKDKEKALYIAKAKAEESSKLKSKFLANMSHEIRTPMNGIIGMSHLVLQTDLSEKQKSYIEKVDSSAKNLLNIINSILDFSKIEAGKLTIEKIDFDMREIFTNLRNIVELKTQEKGLEFSIYCDNKGDKVFYGDSLRIGQILINLTTNAIKFTEFGKVDIKINLLENNIVRFSVKDTGIGLTQEQQGQLFQSFSQADGSTTRKYGGTGLGLSISKQLVELMGGKIWCESALGKGSLFIFEIELIKGDLNSIARKTSTIKADEITALNGSKILLVDDNKINQEIILGLLEQSGVVIDIANNGQEAVDKYKKSSDKYELILMDIQMPIMDGYEATKQIREISKEIPIIALTANAMKIDIKRTKEAGMNSHLNKPIEVDQLYLVLLKYISKKVDAKSLDTQVEPDITLPTFDNIDINKGLKHLANSKKLYLKLLNNFLKDYKELDLDNLSEISFNLKIHTLKGLLETIGATSLHKITKEIEDTQSKILLPKFYEQLNLLIDELEEKLKTNNNLTDENKENLTKEKKENLINQLKEALELMEPEKCNSIIEELEKYKLSTTDKKRFTKIIDFIHQYDFDEALEL